MSPALAGGFFTTELQREPWNYLFPVKKIFVLLLDRVALAFRGGSNGKVSARNTGDPGSIPGLRSLGEGNGNPLQYSCLKNSMDRGTWWATVHGVAKSQRRLSDFTFFHFLSFWTESIWGNFVTRKLGLSVHPCRIKSQRHKFWVKQERIALSLCRAKGDTHGAFASKTCVSNPENLMMVFITVSQM